MKLSVAMCTYNGAQFVEEQLKSILDQEQPVNEIVVCDDGSKDDTLTIVQKIAKEYPHVEWNIQQNSPNLGVTKNFEKAISLCTGDIVFLSDQDDIWHCDKTRVITEYFEENPDKNIVFSDANLVGSDGQQISNYSLLDTVLLKPYSSLWDDGLIFEILNIRNIATGATMAFRRICTCNFIPFDNDKYILHDYQIAISGCKNNTLGIIRKQLVDYRQHANNMVGISLDNWIYTTKTPINLLELLVEPRQINSFFEDWNNGRSYFYRTRYRNYYTVLGKLRLLVVLSSYRKYYHKYWVAFMSSDILYGVVNYKYRQYILNYFRKKWF